MSVRASIFLKRPVILLHFLVLTLTSGVTLLLTPDSTLERRSQGFVSGGVDLSEVLAYMPGGLYHADLKQN